MTYAPDHGTDPESGPASVASRPDTWRSATKRHGTARRQQLPIWQEMFLLLGIALVLAIVIKAFFLQAFYIPSASMNDTLVKDDRILVQKVSYWGAGGPHRGDIVVFADPGGWLATADSRGPGNPVARGLESIGLLPTGGHLVKRVIGIGGDEVMCCDTRGRVSVNGVPLNEGSYLAAGERPSLDSFDVQVASGYVWVMGDNRSNSADSRAHQGDPGGGQVPVDDLVGKVFAVAWPLGHATALSTPATFGSLQ